MLHVQLACGILGVGMFQGDDLVTPPWGRRFILREGAQAGHEQLHCEHSTGLGLSWHEVRELKCLKEFLKTLSSPSFFGLFWRF